MVQEWSRSWVWSSTSPVTAVLVTLLFWAIYLLPAIIAFRRHHRSKWGITALNLLLGWTFFGWAGALAWSLSYPGSGVRPPIHVKEG